MLPRARFTVAVGLVAGLATACGGAAGKPAPMPVAGPVTAAPDRDDGGGDGAPAAGAACITACLDEYGGAGGPDEELRGYCDERCAPIDGPNPACVQHCVRAGEPGGSYDDEGEYQQDEDERSEADVAAHAAACERECATIPTISEDGISACAEHCDPEAPPYCLARCDPDPYDDCVYAPCD